MSKRREIDPTVASMIMNIEETATVWSLIKSDLRPIEDVVAEFNSKFPRDRHFTACYSLSLLLQARALSRLSSSFELPSVARLRVTRFCDGSEIWGFLI